MIYVFTITGPNTFAQAAWPHEPVEVEVIENKRLFPYLTQLKEGDVPRMLSKLRGVKGDGITTSVNYNSLTLILARYRSK